MRKVVTLVGAIMAVCLKRGIHLGLVQLGLVLLMVMNLHAGDLYETYFNLAVGDGPGPLVACDLNNDGFDDLVCANSIAGTISVLISNGNGTFQVQSEYPAGDQPVSISAADFNEDGYAEIVVANQGIYNVTETREITVLFNSGTGAFLESDSYHTADPSVAVCSADLDGDLDIDIAVGTSYAWDGSVRSRYVIFLNQGNGVFLKSNVANAGGRLSSITAGDLSGDGFPDLAVTDRQHYVRTYMSHGDGTFDSPISYAAGADPMSVFMADLDNDGDNDLAVASPFYWDDPAGYLSVFLNNDGMFEPGVRYESGHKEADVYCEDIDQDGDIDMIVSNSNDATITVFANDNTGSFETEGHYGVGSGSRHVVAADFDNDGDTDIASTCGGSDAISVLIHKNIPVVAITEPTGGEAWIIGGTQSISWSISGAPAQHIEILLSRDAGASWESAPIASFDNMSIYQFDWTVTGPEPSTYCKMKVVASNAEGGSEDESGLFMIESDRLAQYDYMRDRLSNLRLDIFADDEISLPFVGFDMTATDIPVEDFIRPGNATEEQDEAFKRMMMAVKLVNAGYRYVPSAENPLTETDEISGAEELWDMGMQNTVTSLATAIVVAKFLEKAIHSIASVFLSEEMIMLLLERLSSLATEGFQEILKFIPDEDTKRDMESIIPILKRSLSMQFAENPCISCIFVEPVGRVVLDEIVLKTLYVPASQPGIIVAGDKAYFQDYTNTLSEAEAAFATEWNLLKSSTDAAVVRVEALEENGSSGGLIQSLQELWEVADDGLLATMKAQARFFDDIIGVSKGYWSVRAAGQAIAEAGWVPDGVNAGIFNIYGNASQAPTTQNGKTDVSIPHAVIKRMSDVYTLDIPDELGRFDAKASALMNALVLSDSSQIFGASEDFLAITDTVQSLFDSLQTEITLRLDSARIYEPDIESLLVIADSCSFWSSQRSTQCVFMVVSLQLDHDDDSFNDFATSVLSSAGSELEACWNGVDSVVNELSSITPGAKLTLHSAESYFESSKDSTLSFELTVVNSSEVPVTDVYIKAFPIDGLSVIGSDSVGLGDIGEGDSITYTCSVLLGSFPDSFSPYEIIFMDVSVYSPDALSGNLNLPIIVNTGYCCTGPSVGNVDASPDYLVTMGDLTVLIDHLFISLDPLNCPEEGNVDLSVDGLVTMGDLTILIDHLFISLNPLPPCP